MRKPINNIEIIVDDEDAVMKSGDEDVLNVFHMG